MKPKATIAVLLALISLSASATPGDTIEVSQTIHRLDRQLFEAFNRCADDAQLQKHASYFARDVEFYHDNGGVTWTRDAMLENTRKYACGHYTRQLVEESFSVSPVKDFGAISTGVHRFCQVGTGQCEGEANFVMVWRYSDGHWEVTRSLSFGHRPATTHGGAGAGISTQAIDEILEQTRVASISVALIESGHLKHSYASGVASAGVNATPSTLYNIASLTKPISAEVALQLVASGKISLDEKMSNAWVDPDIANDPRSRMLTPRHSLSHRTGFPNWRNGKLAFQQDPGVSFGYSGEGYEYLSHFIHKKTSHSIEYWAKRLIFSPNGLRQTTYTDQRWLRANMAFPFDAEGKQLTPQISARPVASDNAFSTPSDYALFVSSVIREINGSGPLSRERSRIQTDRLQEICGSVPKELCPDSAGISVGWEQYTINKVRYFTHTGADEGTFTFVYFSPDTKSGAVIFTNSSNGSKAILPILQLTGADKPFTDFLTAMVRGSGR